MKAFDNQRSYILETERLRLREFDVGDTEFIIALLNSPGWLEYIGDRNVKTKEQAGSYLENGPLKSYKQNGFGLCMVETKEGIPIGMSGIIRRDFLEHPDIGFALLPEYQSQGYAFEIADALLKYAKIDLKLATVFAITLPNNTRSIRLLEHIGLRFSKTICRDASGEELLLYSS
jgi:RimJ/RimL family protein N-acetyltransferase